MGAALTTRQIRSDYWALVCSYLALPIESLDACAAIFIGSGASDDDARENTLRIDDGYPRHISLEQFEEVFGMLVDDAKPHFEFFCSESTTVCAHHVFCSLALLAHGDLHTKIRFLLRLYATDVHGLLPLDRRRMLLRDLVTSLPRTLCLRERIENQVVAYLEKDLLSREDQNLSTCREMYEFYFTSARLSGYLHQIQSVVNGLSAQREADRRSYVVPTSSCIDPKSQGYSKLDGSTRRLKLLNRGATMLQLAHEAVLWSTRVGDLPCFLSQDQLCMTDDTCVRDALRAMLATNNNVIYVKGNATKYLGIISTDDFLEYLVSVLPDDSWPSSRMGEFTRIQIASASEIFGATAIRTVLDNVVDAQPPNKLEGLKESGFHRGVSENERLFNVILRLASGASAVAVFSTSADHSMPSCDPMPATHPLLGHVSAFDILGWLLEDVSILNGKEKYAISSFPWLCHPPSIFDLSDSENGASSTLNIDIVGRFRYKKLHEVLVTTTSTLSDSSRRIGVLSMDSMIKWYEEGTGVQGDGWDEKVGISLPCILLMKVQELQDRIPHMFEPCCIVDYNDSVAHVIQTMVASRLSRVFVQSAPMRSITSVVRASDMLTLLLHEQHCKPRTA